MKVLHVINNLGSGGAEKMLIDFINYQKDNEIDVLLLVDNKISYSLPSEFNYKVLSKTNKRFSFIKLYKLYKFIRKNNYDIIHAHLFPTQYYVALVKLFLGNNIKIITTEHNTTNNRRKNWLFRQIDIFIYSIYDKIIFISEGVKEQFIKDFHKFKNKGIVIPNGINLTEYYKIKKQINSQKIKLLMVARFDKQKDHKTLIKALNLLDEKYTLSLAGKGENLEKIKNLVKKNHLENRVKFLGFVKDIKKIYQTHDIFILSSNWEGFGLVVIEAMAAGLPVIASNVAGLREIVSNSGILFEKGSPNELATKIKEIGEDVNARKKIIDVGKKHAQKYSVENLVKLTNKLYKEVLG